MSYYSNVFQFDWAADQQAYVSTLARRPTLQLCADGLDDFATTGEDAFRDKDNPVVSFRLYLYEEERYQQAAMNAGYEARIPAWSTQLLKVGDCILIGDHRTSVKRVHFAEPTEGHLRKLLVGGVLYRAVIFDVERLSNQRYGCSFTAEMSRSPAQADKHKSRINSLNDALHSPSVAEAIRYELLKNGWELKSLHNFCVSQTEETQRNDQ